MTQITVGTTVFYTGDMANSSGHFVVANIRESSCGTSYDLHEIPSDHSEGREMLGVYPSAIGNLYHGHCNPRFVTETARLAYYQTRSGNGVSA